MILEAGTMLGERYEIIERVGAGGMSIVYKAKCHKLQRNVAVKVLREEFVEDEMFVDRFKVEALSAASLSHPNVVGIYDVGKTEELHYIVMEYVEGQTLKQLITKEGPLDSERVLEYGIQILSAIKHAHSKQIIHRDIKPQNILVTQEGILKVTDFGIARAVDSSTIVATGNAIGSVHYFSPEQAKGKYINKTSDLYSCGIVLFELLTGRLPFEAESHVTIALQHINDELPSLTEINPSISPALANIIKKATEKKQEDRYQDASQMIEDMKEVRVNPNYIVAGEGEVVDDNTVLLSKEDTEYIRNNEKSVTVAPPPVMTGSSQNIVTEEETEESEEEAMYKEKDDKDDISPIYKVLTVIGGICAALLVVGIGVVWGLTSWLNSSSAATEVPVVPAIEGLQVEDARKLVEDEGFKFNVLREESSAQEPGTVLSQNPNAGDEYRAGGIVEVVIAEGLEEEKVEVIVPDVTGLSVADAQRELDNIGLDFIIQREPSDTVDMGGVIEQTPSAGSTAFEGDSVILIVSRGPEVTWTTVPNLEGQLLETVETTLVNWDLALGNVSEAYSNDIEAGRIIDQSSRAGSTVEIGTKIDVIVSLGAEEEEDTDEEDTDEEDTDEENPGEEDTDEEDTDEETPDEEAVEVTKTHIIKLPERLEEEDADNFFVMVMFESQNGVSTVYEGFVQKEQFPMPIEVTGSGSGRLLTYIDGNSEWNDPFSFE